MTIDYMGHGVRYLFVKVSLSCTLFFNIDLAHSRLVSYPDGYFVEDDWVDDSEEGQERLFADVEMEAMRFYEYHRNEMPQVSRSLWRKSIRSMVLTLKKGEVGVQTARQMGRKA